MLKAETLWLLSSDFPADSQGTRLRWLLEISKGMGQVPSLQITPHLQERVQL